jgi:hypothetical protein
MGFASDTGYVPSTIEELMEIIRVNVNSEFGTNYIQQNFVGTNFYKFFYALIQRLQENEIKTSEIFAKMQQYFTVTNEKVLRPNTTAPGILDYFEQRGYLVSVKPPHVDDRGKAYICVDVDDTAPDYAVKKLQIANLVKDCVVLGVVTEGTESETIVLDNSQSFDYKFFLPDYLPVLLRLTITVSDNNLFAIEDPETVKNKLIANIEALYRLGKNFEPQRYFTVADAPWAAEVLLEYSLNDGDNWSSAIYVAEFDEVFTFEPGDVSIVEV